MTKQQIFSSSILALVVCLVNAYQYPVTKGISGLTDSSGDPLLGRGTPFARPKIGNSIVDVIGGTPMVNHRYYKKH